MHSGIHGKRVDVMPDILPGVTVSSHCPRGDANCSAHQEIANLEHEADEASQKLANILTRLANAKLATNYTHSTIVEKFPNEILSLIFCEAWDAAYPASMKWSNGDEEPQEEKKLSLAIRLAGVCKQWRAIALSLPHIWTDVHIFMHRQKGEQTLSVLRDILGRSKDATLTISMHSEPIDEHSRIEQLQPALAILRKESGRWRSLQICLPIQIIKALFTPDMDLSRVSSLYLYSNQYRHSPLSDHFWSNKSLQPDHLSLDSLAFRNIGIAWNRVTHVVAHHFTIDQAMRVIRSAPNLVSFELLEAEEEEEVTGFGSTKFVHENLQHIVYSAPRSELPDAETIFSYCRFPALTRVEHEVLARTAEDSFMDHLMRERPPIEELTLRNSTFFPDYLLSSLKAVSSTLTRLTFAPFEDPFNEPEYDALFMCLAGSDELDWDDDSDWEDDGGMFLPHLEYLEFNSAWPIPWDLIPALFGSPNDPNRRPLKQFIFNKSGNQDDDDHIIPEEDLPALLELRNAGFDFQYRDSDMDGRDLLRVSLEYHNLPVPP
ncbi:hypothetical protein CPC08DRAFT_479792 [Agrocybe pediades]|nr:hypothetical protein CPC08DRAFT_479792 [Agrocybe pediades]